MPWKVLHTNCSCGSFWKLCTACTDNSVVTLILRLASVFIYMAKVVLLPECHESLEIGVQSRFVSQCVADIGLLGEISFDAFAFIVCENLLCRVCFSQSTRLSAHLLICIKFADEIMFIFCLLLIITKYLTLVFSVTPVVYFGTVFLSAQILVKSQEPVVPQSSRPCSPLANPDVPHATWRCGNCNQEPEECLFSLVLFVCPWIEDGNI